MKHGLTGEGVALPSEDQDEIVRRFEALGEEFGPSTESARIHLRRYAFLSIRLERCERHETSILAERVRHAEERFDDRRMAEIEEHASRLTSDPMTSSRRLQATPEGIDWMVEYWLELRGDLMAEDRVVWGQNHLARAQMLMGHVSTNVKVTRNRALTEAVSGFFANLDPADGAGLDDAARAKWARDELAAWIDAEVARLKEVRDSLDLEKIEKDRAESVDRALFDISPEMALARKYEATTERAMYRALKEFKEAEKAAEGPSDIGANNCEIGICAPVASSEGVSEPGPAAPKVVRVPPRRTMPPSPPERPKSAPVVSKDESKAVERARNGPG